MIVALTGATGAVGGALLNRLRSKDSVSEIVILGRRCPQDLPSNVRFVRWELGQPWPENEHADVLVHSAFIMEDTKEQSRATELNVNGMSVLFSSAVAAGVKEITFVSSANAYGLRSGLPALTEDDAITDAPGHFYLHHKYLCENIIHALQKVNPETKYSIVRPCMVTGEGVNNSALATLTASTVLYPKPDFSRYQFVSADDIADAIIRIMESDHGGVYNICPDDSLTVREVAEALGHRAVHVPISVTRRASDIGFALGVIPFSSRWVTYGDPVMNPDKARRELGWSASEGSRDALLRYL
ncbi:NAD-dependent epimerase/dehydratase family protein [Corynebacterium kroppenstedtii]|uniref:NAD-dependent epimerase/dehydratase family protein n=1 Tax=Corynebacterium sp. PCR 32 TaxID=3351342 RepID=UPI0030B74A21